MPEMTPVAAGIIPPDPNKGINSFAGVLGLKQAQQNLETGAIQQQGAAATTQQEQQKNAEFKAAQALIFNGAKSGKYSKADGSLDRQKMADDIASVAPTYGGPAASSLLSQANEIVTNQKTHQELSAAQQGQMGKAFASLASKKDLTPTDVVDTFEELRAANPSPEFSRMLTSMSTHLPANASPQDLQALMGRWSAAATGEGQQTPSTVDAGGAIQPGATNRFSGAFTPAGGAIPKTLTPGERLPHQMTNASGQIINVSPGGAISAPPAGGPASGGGFPVVGPRSPQGVQPAPQNLNPSTAQASANVDAAKVASQGIEAARLAGDQGGSARNVNSQLLNLSRNTSTGPGTQEWHDYLGVIGAPFGGSPNADYQEIGAYLDRQAAYQAQVMGVPNTNAGMAAAERASGTTQYSPKALQEKVKFADALNSGAMAYRKGLDKVIGTGTTPDYSRYQTFRSVWAQNFDPDIFRVEDAQRRGDKEDLAEIKARIGERGMKELAIKSANLRRLENGETP